MLLLILSFVEGFSIGRLLLIPIITILYQYEEYLYNALTIPLNIISE